MTSCWIIYNGFLPGNKFRDFAEMIHEAAISRGHDAVIYKNSEIISFLQQPIHMLIENNEKRPDYVVFTDKDIYLAEQLELLGIPVFNSARTIEVSDDKIKTYQILAAKNIPIPRTIFAPKTYGFLLQLGDYFLQRVIDSLGFPLIVKEAFGSFGEQVYFIQNEAELVKKIKQIAGKPMMFQQFIDTSYGVDLRLQVVGDKVITAMKRESKNDFRANVTSGGSMEPYEPTALEKEIAIRASKAIDAHFSGVDLLFGKDGTPIVCEVNSNAHIRNLFDCTGINVAYDIIHYIEEKLGEPSSC